MDYVYNFIYNHFNQSWNWQLGPKFGRKHLPPINNSPQIDLFLIKGKDIKYMLERSVSGLCSNGSCYSNVLQLSGIRVTYRVTDTNKYNRIKECCTNTFWPLQNSQKIPVFRTFNSLAKNQHTQETWESSTLQMFTGIYRDSAGKSECGVSNLWGLHVYPQSL